MEFFLSKVSQQAVSFAIRSGIIVTSQFAIKECSRYISSIKGKDRKELQALQDRLEQKIRIISPAIDLVEIISARGNTSLESALTLTKNIRSDIQSLGVRVADLSSQEGGRRRRKSQDEINHVVQDIKSLLRKIEDAVPFINLAITTSGVNISSNIPHNVSPSRLMQASTLLTAGDTAYSIDPFHPAQIGTTFTLSLYMLFAGHSHRQEQVSAKDLTWQEVVYKCRVKLQRVPLLYDEDSDDEGGGNTKQLRAQNKIDEYCYELCLIEDLEDGRMHEVEEGKEPPGSFEDVSKAGLRTRIPIHQISKIFYTNSGQLLGIEDSNSPILLIKRDLDATPPRRLVDRIQQYDYDSDSEGEYPLDLGEGDTEEVGDLHELPEAYELPHHLDPEWLAFEVFAESPLDDFDDAVSEYSSAEESLPPPESSPSGSVIDPETSLAAALSNVDLEVDECPPSPTPYNSMNVKSTLSILECLLRLTILQNYQQTSHLAVHDELLTLFLSDSAWTGTRESRQQERESARRRIGFDPFGSPAKPTKESKAGTIHLTGGGASRQGSRRGTPQSFGRASHHLGPSLPMTPNSGAGDSTPNLRDHEPPLLMSEREPWTPDLQLSSSFNSPFVSSPLARKGSPKGNNINVLEGLE